MVRVGFSEEMAFERMPEGAGEGSMWVFGGNLLTLAWPVSLPPHNPSEGSGFQRLSLNGWRKGNSDEGCGSQLLATVCPTPSCFHWLP